MTWAALSMLAMGIGWTIGAKLGWWGMGKLQVSNPALARALTWALGVFYGGFALLVLWVLIRG